MIYTNFARSMLQPSSRRYSIREGACDTGATRLVQMQPKVNRDLMRNDSTQSACPLYYPMFVSLEGRVCLVVGGGPVGERKVRVLLRHGACVRLVARELSPWLQAQRGEGLVTLVGESYEEAHLVGADIVFAATNDSALNRSIAEDAHERKLWCNSATDPESGSFIVPAIYQQGPLSIAVSTAGLSPAVAKRIRERLEKEFGPEWAVFLRLMGLIRTAVQSRELGSLENQRLFKEIAALPLPRWIAGGQRALAVEAIYTLCQPWFSLEELNQLWDEAWKPFSWSLPLSATSAEPLAI